YNPPELWLATMPPREPEPLVMRADVYFTCCPPHLRETHGRWVWWKERASLGRCRRGAYPMAAGRSRPWPCGASWGLGPRPLSWPWGTGYAPPWGCQAKL